MLDSHPSLVFTGSQGLRHAFQFLCGCLKLILNLLLEILLPYALHFRKLSVHLLPGFVCLLVPLARHFLAQGRQGGFPFDRSLSQGFLLRFLDLRRDGGGR